MRLGLLWIVPGMAGIFAASWVDSPRQSPSKQWKFVVSTADPQARNAYTLALAKAGNSQASLEVVFPDRRETKHSIQYFLTDVGHTGPYQIDVGGPITKSLRVDESCTLVDPDGARDALASGYRIIHAPDWHGTTPTYSGRMKSLLGKCVGCHVKGGVAPFALDTYEQAKKWAPMLVTTLKAGKMPPYRAVHGYRDIHASEAITELDIQSFEQWNLAGAPQGTPKPEKARTVDSTVWPYGKPDLILKPKKAYPIKADGPEEYRCFPLKTNFKEKRYLRMVDLKPLDGRVVHHVIIYYDQMGNSANRDFEDGRAGYPSEEGFGFLPTGAYGGWVPGSNLHPLPEGAAFELHPGASIVLQVHYSPIGIATSDQIELGLYFFDGKPKEIANYGFLEDRTLRIPANEPNYLSKGTYEITENLTVYAMVPHMHMLAQRMRVEFEPPQGKKQTVFAIDNWDFSWQLAYYFKQPLKVAAGSTFYVTSAFDNSTSNPNNPHNPPRMVRAGNRTSDEMSLLVYLYTIANTD